MDRATSIEQARAMSGKAASRIMKSGGYKSGGKVDPDRAEDAAMIHKHEGHLHKGEPKTKYARGGMIGGKGAKHKAHGKARVHINIINGAGGGDPHAAAQQGLAMGAKLGAMAAMHGGGPGGPPPGMGGPPMGPPPGMAPPGAGPMPPPGMAGPPTVPGRPPGFKRGGGIPNLKGGAGGGQGRIAKALDYGGGSVAVKGHLRKYPHKSGGRVK